MCVLTVTLTGGLRPRGLPSAARVVSGLSVAASDQAVSTSLEAENMLAMFVGVVVVMVVEVVVM